MRITLLLVLLLLALSGFIGLAFIRGDAGLASSSMMDMPPAPTWPREVAAHGIVEGAKPEVALRPEVVGMLRAINVRANQEVPEGFLLAELHNETQVEEVALAAAEVTVAKAQLERLRNGERIEKRTALAAFEQSKRVTYQQARRDWERTHKLLGVRQSSQEQADRDYAAMLKAEAEWEEAAAERALVDAPARADEVKAAEGRIEVAEARLRLARAALKKTRLLAPTAGHVLRVYSEPGEIAGPNTQQPVLLMADLSVRRVRAFIEELDAPRVAVGQRASVTADGLPGKKFAGAISTVFPRMRRGGLQTDAADEYKDIYFREVLIDLDSGQELPLNLRVETRIEVGPIKESG